jgi:hypothetical protein
MEAESYDRIREAVIFWGALNESYESLDDWPIERLYRYADGYIEAHTVKET